MSTPDPTTPRGLRDRYAIAGVGETDYTRGSGRTTRALATQAIRAAMADAGLGPGEVDGMLSYHMGDSTPSPAVASDLGLRLNFFTDIWGGGSSTECLIGIATGVIEAGMCRTVAIFRAMNGYSGSRVGGTGAGDAAIRGDALHSTAYGWFAPGQWFAPTFLRYMHDRGVRPEDAAEVKVAHSYHASNNPKALLKKRVTVEDVLASQ